jgi:hypothetical protein
VRATASGNFRAGLKQPDDQPIAFDSSDLRFSPRSVPVIDVQRDRVRRWEKAGYRASRTKIGRPPSRLRRFGARAGATYSASR